MPGSVTTQEKSNNSNKIANIQKALDQTAVPKETVNVPAEKGNKNSSSEPICCSYSSQSFRYRSAGIAARISPRTRSRRDEHMPEQRGKQATADVKSEWTRAYQIYLRASGDRYDKKKDRTARIDSVAQELKLTRKQAKRRVRNYEAWQRNIKKGLVEP